MGRPVAPLAGASAVLCGGNRAAVQPNACCEYLRDRRQRGGLAGFRRRSRPRVRNSMLVACQGRETKLTRNGSDASKGERATFLPCTCQLSAALFSRKTKKSGLDKRKAREGEPGQESFTEFQKKAVTISMNIANIFNLNRLSLVFT